MSSADSYTAKLCCLDGHVAAGVFVAVKLRRRGNRGSPAAFAGRRNYTSKGVSVNILGINSVYHESAAALLIDGKLVAAVEEERFNRIKHGKEADFDNPHQFPERAIRYCLNHAGLTAGDIDHVAYSFDHQPEAQHPKSFNYPQAGPADYPILSGGPEVTVG